jgi:hypothetical protein
MEQYEVKPQESYAVFSLKTPEGEAFEKDLTALSAKGLVTGQQLTDLLKGQNLGISVQEGGHMSIYDKSKKEVARVVPLIGTA